MAGGPFPTARGFWHTWFTERHTAKGPHHRQVFCPIYWKEAWSTVCAVMWRRCIHIYAGVPLLSNSFKDINFGTHQAEWIFASKSKREVMIVSQAYAGRWIPV